MEDRRKMKPRRKYYKAANRFDMSLVAVAVIVVGTLVWLALIMAGQYALAWAWVGIGFVLGVITWLVTIFSAKNDSYEALKLADGQTNDYARRGYRNPIVRDVLHEHDH